jgi:hypothetical protein
MINTNNNAVNEEPKARKYIREWKRQDYQKNPEKIKEKNKKYYYKNKANISLCKQFINRIEFVAISYFWKKFIF